MNRKIHIAVAVVLGAAGLVSAQTRVDRSGANDANNKIGSGGRNDPREQPKPWMLNNDIFYGNVTGGKGFRGQRSSFDATEFRGNVAGRNVDRFTKDSSGITTSGIASFNANQTRQFYGDSRAVAPPAGTIRTPGGTGFIPPRPLTTRTIDPRVQSLSEGFKVINRPADFGMSGPMDTQYVPDAVIIPSVPQMRQLQDLTDYTPLNRDANSLSPSQLQQLRQELNIPALQDRQSNTPSDDGSRKTPGELDSQIKGRSIDDQITNNAGVNALSATIDPTQSPEPGVRHRLATASEQNSTYAKLQARKQEMESRRPGQANQEAADEFNAAMRAKTAADQNGGQQPKTGAIPGGSDQPKTGAGENKPTPKTTDQPAPDNKDPGAATPTPTPLKVPSLAGDNQTGLNELLKRAETQLREGKFSTAIETYEQAEKVAPNNPLIKLGRTHAELGGGYYRRAQNSLRQTLTADKNLLAGQYDLKGFIGEQRLQTVERDLQDLIQRDKNDTGAVLLLAYVYYNTANERRAAALLDLAEKRDPKDQFVATLKKNWALPEPDAIELNK